jgi:antitoxin ParD1/3/4
MPTRNVVITDHQNRMIDELVASGRYQNASEVLREGLRLIEARAAREAAKLQALREAVQVGLDDIEAGRFVEVGSPEELAALMQDIALEATRSTAAAAE